MKSPFKFLDSYKMKMLTYNIIFVSFQYFCKE